MENTNISSIPTTEEEKKKDSFGNSLDYIKELWEANMLLKKRVSGLENEIGRLVPAAHFLRCRDALHKQIQSCLGIIEACRVYRKNPSRLNGESIINSLRNFEKEEEM